MSWTSSLSRRPRRSMKAAVDAHKVMLRPESPWLEVFACVIYLGWRAGSPIPPPGPESSRPLARLLDPIVSFSIRLTGKQSTKPSSSRCQYGSDGPVVLRFDVSWPNVSRNIIRFRWDEVDGFPLFIEKFKRRTTATEAVSTTIIDFRFNPKHYALSFGRCGTGRWLPQKPYEVRDIEWFSVSHT